MTVKFGNRVKHTLVGIAGTGNLTFGTAVAGYQTFNDASYVAGDVCHYTIENGTQFEIGTGTITVAGGVFGMSRVVIESSETNNAALSVPASATCFVTVLAQDIVQNLPNLLDVDTTVPNANQVLAYDSNIAKWKPVNPAGGISSVANQTALAAVTGMATKDFIWVEDSKSLYIYDGTEWDRVYTDTNAVPEWTTAPPTSELLAKDGTATTQTVVAADPEGFPIEYSYDTNPSNQTQATISQSNGTFTITPSTSNAGDFVLRYKASDGLHSTARSTAYSLSFLPQTDALFGRWDMGESASYVGSGTTWNDLSGNGRNLTIENGSYNSSGFGGTPVWEWTSADARIDLPDDLSSVKTYVFILGLPTGSTRLITITSDSSTYLGYINSGSGGGSMAGGATHAGETRSSNMNGNAMSGGGAANANYGYMEANKLNIYALRGYKMTASTTKYADYSAYYAQAHQLRAIFIWTTTLTDAEIKEVYDTYPSGSMATWDG